MTRPLLLGAASAAVTLLLAWPRSVASHETITTTVLFDREVVRILDSHCVMCHVEGGPASPLATYEQVWLQKRKISAEMLARHMPPWAALPGYGRFVNENVVTLRESQFIVSWMEGLGPRNAGRVFTNTAAGGPPAAAVRAEADFGRWQLGQPDLTRELPPLIVDAGRPDDVIRTVVAVGTSSQRSVRAFEYMPGDRRVIRAAFFVVQETGQWIGSWTPWYGFVKLPSAVGYQLPAGAHIAAEIHLRHTSEQVVERGRIGLFFDAGGSAIPVESFTLTAARDNGDASRSAVRLQASSVLAADTALLALQPDVVPGLASVEVSARRLDGGTEVLLFAKDIPSAWPTPYIFKEPVHLRRGTKLSVTAYLTEGTPVPAGGLHVTISGHRVNAH